MAFCNFNFFNSFCNCGLNNMFMPFANFQFFNNFSLPAFNTPIFNFNNFLPYQSFQQPIFNFPNFNYNQMNNANFNNNIWAQAGMNFNYNLNFDSINFSTKSSNSTKPSSSTKNASSDVKNRTYGSLQEKFYKTGLSFVGKINTDSQGNARFSNGRDNQWCADFVSTLAHETFGDKLPAGFPDARKHSVSCMSIKSWGEKNNRYLDLPETGIANFIAKNVKPGDIMIISRGGGKGHAAIVTKINDDGTFETVEGNCSNAVKHKTRQPKVAQDSKGVAKLIGFVQMGDIA